MNTPNDQSSEEIDTPDDQTSRTRVLFVTLGIIVSTAGLIITWALVINSPQAVLPTPIPTATIISSFPCTLISSRIPISTPPLQGSAEILAPDDCSIDLPLAPASILVSGVYTEELEKKALWVLVYPPNGSYYPQAEDVCELVGLTMSQGRWDTNVFLGRPEILEQFDIVLVMATTEADNLFKDYLKNGCETEDYPGFSSSALPEGLTELDAITVYTGK